MRERELLQDGLPGIGDLKGDLTPIVLCLLAADETALRRARRQLDRAVVLNLQALRDHADRGARGGGQAFQRKEELVLLRLDPGAAGRRLAEVEEAANAVADLCERSIVRGSDMRRHGAHIYRFTIYTQLRRADVSPA